MSEQFAYIPRSQSRDLIGGLESVVSILKRYLENACFHTFLFYQLRVSLVEILPLQICNTFFNVLHISSCLPALLGFIVNMNANWKTYYFLS